MRTEKAWSALAQHRHANAALDMRDLFAQDAHRGTRLSLQFDDLYLDFSKNLVTDETLALLLQLAEHAGLEQAIEAMFAGEKINFTERRAVLHTALRNPPGQPVIIDGQDVMPAIDQVLQRMDRFARTLRDGEWSGFSGKPITDLVHIGIGGSHLGPHLVTDALNAYAKPGLNVHFVSNVDGAAMARTLGRLCAETTLFIVASKTFTTQETMLNAVTAKNWFLNNGGTPASVCKHFVAVSTNLEATRAFGIAPENVFEFWDWVGGRYSLWSAIGLPIVLYIGGDAFRALLDGAHRMDLHFRSAPWHQNMPVILALLGIWYTNFHHAETHAVLPYDERLRRLPDYLQQVDMESNGKRAGADSKLVPHPTGPVIWGGVGTDGQHSFFQSLHQGTHLVPADFLLARKSASSFSGHHDMLAANCLAQSEALLYGKDEAQIRAELGEAGMTGQEIERLAPHKVFPGNRPSNTLLLEDITPRTLGSLMAMYEHKVFVQGVIWGINSFDQWGVELGKQLASSILQDIRDGGSRHQNSSTKGLLQRYRTGT